jgi:hypothetical protein
MSEWWTYTLSDFLLFSSSTYDRLFELYNAAIWPLQVATGALGLAAAALLARARSGARAVLAILCAACLWVALAFLYRRYATINWAAVYFAWVFGLEAVLIAHTALFSGTARLRRPAGAAAVGIAILLVSILAWPLSAPLWHGGWRRAQIFGVAPDPTAVGILGVLLALDVRRRWSLMVLPATWCAISGVTLLAMKAPDAAACPVAAAVAGVLAVRQARSPRGALATVPAHPPEAPG